MKFAQPIDESKTAKSSYLMPLDYYLCVQGNLCEKLMEKIIILLMICVELAAGEQ